MSFTIELLSIRSRNESSEASASDEAFVIATVANLRHPSRVYRFRLCRISRW